MYFFNSKKIFSAHFLFHKVNKIIFHINLLQFWGNFYFHMQVAPLLKNCLQFLYFKQISNFHFFILFLPFLTLKNQPPSLLLMTAIFLSEYSKHAFLSLSPGQFSLSQDIHHQFHHIFFISHAFQPLAAFVIFLWVLQFI